MALYEDYIDDLRHHDEQAFEMVYKATKNAVYTTIYAIVKNHHASEDLMQETYLTMLEKIHEYQSKNRFLSWLLVIARHKAIDYYRKKQRETIQAVDTMEYLADSVKPVGERSVMVDEMLKPLTDIEREIFLLYVVNNLKHREIARITSMPLGTVLWHYQKAKQKIKK